MRFPGDVVFIVGGVLPVLYICWLAVRCQMRPPSQPAAPVELLFTDVVTSRDPR
jgi:nitric oxide reductase subunit B